MKKLRIGIKPIVTVAGIGLLIAGGTAAYWRFHQNQWCVRFTSSGGQEVTYSRGCINPQRYKRWVTTASVQG